MKPEVRALIMSIAALMLVSSLPFTLVGPLSSYIQDDLHFSDAMLGVVVGSYPFALMLFSLPVGRLINRFGVRSGVRLCLAVTVASTAIAIASTSWVMLVASMLLCGCAGVLGDISSAGWVAVGVPPHQYGVSYGVRLSMSPAAAMLGGLAVPIVGDAVGWRWAFAGVAVAAAVLAMVLGHGPPARPSRTVPSERGTLSSDLLVLGACIAVAQSPVFFMLGFMVKSAVASGLSDAEGGVLFAFSAAIGILWRVAAGSLVDRGTRSPIDVIVVYLLLGSLTLVGLATGRPWVIVIACPVSFVSLCGWQALAYVFVIRKHTGTASLASSMLSLSFAGGAFIGSISFGAIAGQSIRVAWLLAAVMPVVASCGLVLARPRLGLPPWRLAMRTQDEPPMGQPL